MLFHIGNYFLMLAKVFGKFTKWSVLKRLIFADIESLIIGSMGIVSFISFFVGGVVAIQTALNLDNPLLPDYLVGYATRQSVILEFAPTFISIIMAGKAGSFITSSIGTMRVTEQIDALEVMGINTYNYLIFPKIVALMLYPFVITFSMFLGIFGGYMACVYGDFHRPQVLSMGFNWILFPSTSPMPLSKLYYLPLSWPPSLPIMGITSRGVLCRSVKQVPPPLSGRAC